MDRGRGIKGREEKSENIELTREMTNFTMISRQKPVIGQLFPEGEKIRYQVEIFDQIFYGFSD